MDNLIINSDDFFESTRYVRTRVISVTEGDNDLNDLYVRALKEHKKYGRNCTVHELELPGDPIIDKFELSQVNVMNPFLVPTLHHLRQYVITLYELWDLLKKGTLRRFRQPTH